MVRKTVRVLLFFAPLIIGSLPLVDGIIFKNKFYEFIDIINHDRRIQIDILEYHRGWINSRVKLRIGINKKLTNLYQQIGNKQLPPISVIIDENISHGPIVYNRIKNRSQIGYAFIQSDIYLASTLQTLFPGAYKGAAIMRLDMFSKFNNDWSGQIQIPTILLTLKSIGNLNWSGMDGEFDVSIRQKRIKDVSSISKIGSISITKDEKNAFYKNIIIQPMDYQYDVRHQNRGIWSGNTLMTMPGFVITLTDGKSITGHKTSVYSAFSMDDEYFYNTNATIGIQDFQISDYFISSIPDVHLMISADNFTSKGLNEYIANFKSDLEESLNVQTLGTFLAHTIDTNSVLQGHLAMATSLGNFNAEFKVNWDQSMPAPNTMDDVIKGAYTEINVKASPLLTTKVIESLAKGVDQFIADVLNKSNKNVVAKTTVKPTDPSSSSSTTGKTPEQLVKDLTTIGYIGKDVDNSYYTRFTIDDGVVKINGRPLNP